MYMDFLDKYVLFIFMVKIIFIILALTNVYLKIKKSKDKKLLAVIEYWKQRAEFVFIALMSMLLIYIFNPRTNRILLINKESKLLFYLFGFILLITAKWEVFITDSFLLKRIQMILGNEGTR